MTTAERNRPWNLESFLDSLIHELDRARDTLAVKSVNRPLTYTVQDVQLDVQCFPQYDGRGVRFVTAEPGASGASELRVQLGSVTANHVRETTTAPVTDEDVPIAVLDDLDDESKEALERIGVKTESDLQRMEQRGVDLQVATGRRVGGYSDLAGLINKARRARQAPTVSHVDLTRRGTATVLSVRGRDLALRDREPGFPRAYVGQRPVDVLDATDERVDLAVPTRVLPDGPDGSAALTLALDPYAVVTMELRP